MGYYLRGERDKMLSIGVRNTSIAFGQESKIVTTKNGLNFQQLKQVQDTIDNVIREIGGVSGAVPNNEIKIAKALEKMKQLRRETQEAWGACPSALKQKIDKLDKLETTLKSCSEAFNNISDAIDKEPEGLILPESCKKDTDKKIITDSSEIISAYNQLLLSKTKIGEILPKGAQSEIFNASAIKEIKAVTTTLKQDNWDFAKFNELDSKVYSKIKDTLLIGNHKKTVEAQLELIEQKLQELKDNKGVFIKEVGVKVYSPETTGKIMALETAKLRRTTLKQTFIMPGVSENLDKADVMLQPISAGAPIAFKIDRSFIPKKTDINQLLNLNKNYQPVLNKLFPDGLPVFIVPGYINDQFGSIEGGMSIPGSSKEGVWLNSYDTEERYTNSSMKEKTTARLREVPNLNPSVLKGNKDRARALAHEIGHAISYRLMELDQAKIADKAPSSGLLLTNNDIDFMTAWEGLRTGAKYNNSEKDKHDSRYMSDDNKAMLYKFVDYETVAEDIRIALTGKELPASSKMTGIFDHTEEGNKQIAKSINFLRKVLLEDISPADALIQSMQAEQK